jgi:hypothetical protein
MPIAIDDLITSIEVEYEQTERAIAKAAAEVKYVLAQAREHGRPNLTEEEDSHVEDLFAAQDRGKKALTGIERKLNQARRAKADELTARETSEEREANPLASRVMPADRDKTRQVASVAVGRNERTYRPDTDKRGIRFLQDVSRAFLFGDVESQHRLSSHMQEERIDRGAKYFERAAGDSTTANWAGLTVPQYLTDMYAPAVAALRPFADVCNKHDLPPNGMTVNISLITTPSQVGAQPTGELNAVLAQSIDDTLLTENVQTAAGQVTLSRQAIDRGTGIEEVTMQDLFRRYATNLDNTLVNQATTGLSALAVANTYNGSFAINTAYSKIMGAASGVEAALLAQATPSHVIMYSSRWWNLAAQVGTNFPFINVMGPQYPWSGGVMNPEGSYAGPVRGVLPSGLKVIADNNVPNNLGASTNQDEMYVVAADECHLWEDPDAPVFIRAEQPKAASLGVLLVLYGYFAYTFRRYANAVQKVNGTALTTPSF